MAAISSLGIGANLDLTSLLANIKSGEQAPLAALQRQQTSFTTKLSAYGQVNNALTTLQKAAEALAKASLFTGVQATSSATEVLSATAAASAPAGVYAVNVTQLAQAQSLASAGVANSSDALATGTDATTLMFDFGKIAGGTLDANGKYTGASFTPAALPAATAANSISIDPAKSSLADIRDAINGNAALGVTASIVNDGSASPSRLVLTSKASGETASMRVTVIGDPALAALLSNDPAGLPAAQLQQTVAAQNAKLTVNGVAITSASNSVVGAVQDVTLSVAKLGSSSLTVANDTASVQVAMTNFVNAYNGLQSVAGKLTAFDADKGVAGSLLGDGVLRSVQVRIRSALTSPQVADGSGLSMMSQIGISFQKDGTLAIDNTKLTAALGSKLEGVANLFTGSNGVGGYGSQMTALLTSFTEPNGILASATKGINTTLDRLGKQYTATSERVDATVARYKAQFTELDLMMSRMTATSTYLTQQFDALNQSTKN